MTLGYAQIRKTMPIAVSPKATAASGSSRSMAASVPRTRLPQTAKSPALQSRNESCPGCRSRAWMPSPNQRQRQRDEDGHKKQPAHHGKRQADIILPVEQYPRRQCEPGHEPNRTRIEFWMQMIEDGFVMGDKFPGHRSVSPCCFGI